LWVEKSWREKTRSQATAASVDAAPLSPPSPSHTLSSPLPPHPHTPTPTPNAQHFVPGSTQAAAKSKKKKGGRHDGTNTEAAEDDALLADEGAAEGVGHRLEVQPGVITGTMRKYQIEGLNWLIHLFDHSMNGILADEMGLGKVS
jgi:SNF2 family DNA or RNA helicase